MVSCFYITIRITTNEARMRILYVMNSRYLQIHLSNSLFSNRRKVSGAVNLRLTKDFFPKTACEKCSTMPEKEILIFCDTND